MKLNNGKGINDGRIRQWLLSAVLYTIIVIHLSWAATGVLMFKKQKRKVAFN